MQGHCIICGAGVVSPARLLAVRTAGGDYQFNPAASTRVQPGSHLIAMDDPVSVQHLRDVAGDPAATVRG